MNPILRSIPLSASLLLCHPFAHAQNQSAPPPAQEEAEGSEDIVVTGLRDLDDRKSAVTRKTFGSNRIGAGARNSRSTFYFAQRFAKCAMERSPKNLLRLKRVLDARTNSSKQALAQQQLVRAHVSCTENPTAVLQMGSNASLSLNYDTAYYDRGALFIEAIKTFGPDLKLTRGQTADPAIQARFNSREISLASFRLPVDRRYFETAVCLVRMQPELAVRLVRTDGPNDIINALEASIVNRARVCVGGAKHVYFDPAQFRFYIADAVYRWAVAAKGTDSLIPDG